jgi:hypothetical protein
VALSPDKPRIATVAAGRLVILTLEVIGLGTIGARSIGAGLGRAVRASRTILSRASYESPARGLGGVRIGAIGAESARTLSEVKEEV